MTPVALAFAVLQARQGEHLLGYILAAQILPNVLLVLIGGSVSDRHRRDRLIQLGYLGSGLSQAGIAAVVLGGANPYWIFPWAVASGLLGAVTSPALRGVLPDLVDGKDIREANALLNTSRSVARIVGPTAAGILTATFGGGWGIAADSASFFVASLFMARVRIPSRPPAGRPIFEQMREGWSYFRRRRWIWLITSAFAVMNPVQMGVWQVLGPILARRAFGPAGWGLALSVKSLGLLIAGLALLRFPLRRPLRDGMIAIAASGLPMIALGQGYGLAVLIALAAFAGAGSAVSGISWDTTLQRAVPKEMLSRVCAFDDFGSYVTIPLGEMLALPLAGAFGFQTVATAGGILFVAVALLPLSDRTVRRMAP